MNAGCPNSVFQYRDIVHEDKPTGACNEFRLRNTNEYRGTWFTW